MGTTWSVRLVDFPGADEAILSGAIEAELAAIVALFSHWDPRSELARFNAAPAGTWAVSQPFWSFVDECMDLAGETRGAVDPTLGALVDLWGFGPPGPRPENDPLPTDAEIEAALAVSGRWKLRFNREARAMIQPGGLKLDLSALAKGHAVDCVSDRLIREGATSHLVEIGGELKGVGVKPDLQPWWVEIEAVPGDDTPPSIVALCGLAVATSGDYRRAFTHSGRVYSHTLDPETGRPVDNGVVSATVIHSRALYADAYATALTTMGPYRAPDWAEAWELAARIVERTPRGLVEHLTPAWRAMMEDPE
ncbi:FAD:protein FMN transferase [Rhizobium sp. CRIBSB]|nr:FAD:protein FMN transferase [Rhizobium sp. CRIBSB]